MKICSVENCGRKTAGRGLCKKHWKRWRKHGDPEINLRANEKSRVGSCSVEGCTRVIAQNGLCNMHEMRRRTGQDLTDPNAHRAANGTGIITSHGYRRFSRAKGKYVYEHVEIAEKALGKPLPKGAEVHHVNGDRKDNRPENLVVCPNRAYHRLIEQRTRAFKFKELFGEFPTGFIP